ncbi:hypothetical protein V5N11_019420 [Cardamine amara subsp. amara]|uniref:DUF4378 domain-containing protein n=1 Tax=Cardamine amara subsp. amara TaxID=228776 RepID=A0ABD1A987_CARAN
MNKQRRRNVQAHGCLSRVVNLFDFGTVGNGKKLLTETPHFDNGFIKRNQFDQIEDKVDVGNGGVNGTPMKKLLEQEMSKDMEFKLGSTSLIAKLMGLDSFPQTQPVSRSSSNLRLKRSLSHGEYKDVYEIWRKSNGVEGLSKKKMDIVREKFLEAKRLVTDDKLRHSKEFKEAMEVLSSNKELFLEFLQESNNLFSHHLHSFQSSAPPTPEKSKRITILKPSKTIESSRDGMKSEMGRHLFEWPVEEEHPTKQSTRIVVLKPKGNVIKASSCPTSPRRLPVDDFDERESRDIVRKVKRQMLKEENLHSSVFSNGYIGDDSSLNRSENDYADSEIMSPVSRHSWDYINKYDSPFSSSPFSRASDSPESSSVCREAKKRLSERWALMAASNEDLQEAEVIQKKVSNTTLGDMLALPDLREDLRTEEEVEEISNVNEQEGSSVFASCLSGNFIREEGNSKPLNSLMRSKSLPESSTSLGQKALDTKKGKSKVPEKLTKSTSLKWSLKGKVSNFLFSRNKKTSKEESQVVNPEVLDSRRSDEYDASVSARSMFSREGGLSVSKPTTFGNSSEWRDEPSPISVLETSFDEDDEIFFSSSVLNRSSSSLETEMKSNLLGKSPPIGSIGRTFSFDDSTVGRCYSSKRSTTSTRDEEEDLRLLIHTLLSAADLDEEESSSSPLSILDNLLSKWHSVESPLDPSLRNSYADSTELQRLGSNVKKLVFDLVNTLLLELTPSYLGPRSPMILSGKTLRGYVVNRMLECLKGIRRVEDRWWDEDGDLSSLAVNKVVRIEVAEIGSRESLRLEMDSMGEELELKLLEELVEEVMMDLSERPKLFFPSIC